MRLALIRQRYNPHGGGRCFVARGPAVARTMAGRLMALYASLAPSRARRPA